jgi:hypothetical protein
MSSVVLCYLNDHLISASLVKDSITLEYLKGAEMVWAQVSYHGRCYNISDVHPISPSTSQFASPFQNHLAFADLYHFFIAFAFALSSSIALVYTYPPYLLYCLHILLPNEHRNAGLRRGARLSQCTSNITRAMGTGPTEILKVCMFMMMRQHLVRKSQHWNHSSDSCNRMYERRPHSNRKKWDWPALNTSRLKRRSWLSFDVN